MTIGNNNKTSLGTDSKLLNLFKAAFDHARPVSIMVLPNGLIRGQGAVGASVLVTSVHADEFSRENPGADRNTSKTDPSPSSLKDRRHVTPGRKDTVILDSWHIFSTSPL